MVNIFKLPGLIRCGPPQTTYLPDTVTADCLNLSLSSALSHSSIIVQHVAILLFELHIIYSCVAVMTMLVNT